MMFAPIAGALGIFCSVLILLGAVNPWATWIWVTFVEPPPVPVPWYVLPIQFELARWSSLNNLNWSWAMEWIPRATTCFDTAQIVCSSATAYLGAVLATSSGWTSQVWQYTSPYLWQAASSCNWAWRWAAQTSGAWLLSIAQA